MRVATRDNKTASSFVMDTIKRTDAAMVYDRCRRSSTEFSRFERFSEVPRSRWWLTAVGGRREVDVDGRRGIGASSLGTARRQPDRFSRLSARRLRERPAATGCSTGGEDATEW